MADRREPAAIDSSAPRGGAPGPSSVPICVDLDGTLVRTDVLGESIVRLACRRPLALLGLSLALLRGRARLKEVIAARVRIDPANLPYNAELLDFLRERRREGRRLFLVTACHRKPATAVADHVALFDEVLATDGRVNLKSRRKRSALVERFGEGGFDYAGNSAADLPVWSAAREAIVVNASRGIERRVGARVKRVLDAPRTSRTTLLLRAIRIRQWVKNLLVFLPMALAHRLFEPAPFLWAVVAFLSFGLGASAIYVLNDLLGVEADRRHPRKRLRPFASGDLPPQAGFALIPLLAAASLALALVLPLRFLAVLLLYFVLATAYSLYLKQVALVDVVTLAGLYTVRILAGAAATSTAVSEWLLAFSVFIFLSLGAVKRYAELYRLRRAGEAKVEGRRYFSHDLEVVLVMGLSSGYLAVLVLALYVTSENVKTLYARPDLVWLVCPLLLCGISRIWFLARRNEVEDDPVSFAARDPLTWGVGLASGLVLVLATRGF